MLLTTGLWILAVALTPPGQALAGTPVPQVSAPVQVVPSDGLPPEVHDNRSNNNVHVIRHHGRTYMVFRTAHWHIAADDATLYVVSSRDQLNWRFEGKFAYGRDVREARLLFYRGELFLYFALLGQNPSSFEPGGTMVARERKPGHWTDPEHILQDDFVPWAVKRRDGVPYMLGYTGGGGTFQPDPPEKVVYWLTTRDGIDWRPVGGRHGVVYRGQCGETDFEFLKDGSLLTACQTENDDALGWGAKVCTAPAHDTADWTCRGDPRRLDSPWIFTQGGSAYVIARRQPNFGGNYDLGLQDTIPDRDTRFQTYDALYAGTTKRCAVWSIDPRTREFDPLVDIPGMGDTCYPATVRDGRRRLTVYNYTSPLDGIDQGWFTALTTGTSQIYRARLTFAR
jgi:hypothetical protein